MSLRSHAFIIVTIAAWANDGSPAAGQVPAVQVTMQNFKFEPAVFHLRAGQQITLHLVNNSSGGHSFTAPAFLAASSVALGSTALARTGSIEVAGHQAVDVTLIPRAGRYPLKCAHRLHKTLGMSGTIVVD